MAATVEGSMSSAPMQEHGKNELESKDAWSNAAEGYNSSMAKYPLHSARAGLDAAQVQVGEKLLDVACGPGDLAIDAATRKGATVDCIDFSEGMIETLQKKLEKEPCAVTAHLMDGQNLQFDNSSFDVVSSSFGVMLFPDWRKGLKEMVRVTKPGGRVLLVVPDANTEGKPGASAMELWTQVLEAQFPETLPLPIPAGVTELGRTDLIREVLSGEGLQNIQVAQVPFTFHIDDPGSVAKHCMINPLMQEVQKKLSQERCKELVAAVKKNLEDSRLEDGSRGRVMGALTAVAYKPA